MMKFFRKYNKHLLAVFMVLLMIVFVGGTALEDLMAPSIDLVVATSRLEPSEILNSDRTSAMFTTDTLARLGQNWRQLGGPGVAPIETIDWILLRREAASLGMVPDKAAMRAALSANGGLSVIKDQARRMRKKEEHVVMAMAELQAIRDAGQVMAASATPSAAEIRVLGRDILDKVEINAVVLPASVFEDESATFSEEAVVAQWEKYKDAKPGAKLEFGYYVAPRLICQFVHIDRDKIADVIGVPNLEKKARRLYDDKKETDPAFRRSVAPDPASDGPQPEPFLTWEEAKAIAESMKRKEFADEAAQRMADWLVQYAAEPWLDVERGDDGYKTAPEPVRDAAYYETIVGRMPKTIAFPEALSVGVTIPFSDEEAQDVAELGPASAGTGTGLDFRSLAFRNKAIVDQVPEADRANVNEYLAMHQTCPYSVKNQDGDIFVFRVVGAEPGHVAESVDEVRSRVIADLRLMQGYEAAKIKAEGMMSNAEDVGLQEAYETDDELNERMAAGRDIGGGFMTAPATARAQEIRVLYNIGGDTTYVGNGIGAVPSAIIGEWFDLEFTDTKMGVYELEDRAAVLVAEWVDTTYGRWDEFEDLQPRLVSGLTRQRRDTALQQWFDPERIRDRTGFELATR